MLSADYQSFQHILNLLKNNQQYAYWILFLGAYFETVLPISLMVFGEFFFLAGAILAGIKVLNIWIVMLTLFSGGILGDNTSYWLGRRFGFDLIQALNRWPFIGRLIQKNAYENGIVFFQKRGGITVFLARLSGPFSWITPTLAGIFKMKYPVFLRFNTPAVIIGIGEFIIAGFFFGNYLPQILDWSTRYKYYFYALLIVCVLIITLFVIKRHARYKY